ncbi:MAG: SMP-30/gluconolactonase/LRE family protein [Cyclobacteriaceae bacterium]
MNSKYLLLLSIHLSFGFLSCDSKSEKENLVNTIPLEIEKFHPSLDKVIGTNPTAQVIGSGYEWTEGPLWLESEQMLLFSEIPENKIHVWKEGADTPEVYLDPAGFTGTGTRGGELGSNGLLLDPEGNLVLCQHGDRRLARMAAPLDAPEARYETIIGRYMDKPFNSPNDAVYDAQGNLYFTDPPYGLEYNMDDPKKGLPFQGVYLFTKEGDLELLLDSISRPNGLAFAEEGKKLIIANSDPENPVWYLYEVSPTGLLEDGRVFYDASEQLKNEKGLPDGLKINSQGTIFATGPGGIWVFDEKGTLLGRMKFNQLTSNVALNDKENTLFVTADSYVVKIDLQ